MSDKMDNVFVSSLLEELMTEYNRVSLPCLGSFLGQYKPAYISDDGLIMPPSKKIVFHQNEIWNDEKLEKLIARNKRISFGEAKEKLAFWIDEICVLLATGEQVEFPGFGHLRVADHSRLIFEQDSPNLLRESFGLEPAPVTVDTAFVPSKYTYPVHPVKPSKTGKIILITAISLLVLALCAAAYWYIVKPRMFNETGEKAQPANQTTTFVIPPTAARYCILLGSFEGINEARACVKSIAGEVPAIFYVSGAKPYLVSSGEFSSLTVANDSLAALRKRDSAFISAKVAEINPKRKAVNR